MARRHRQRPRAQAAEDRGKRKDGPHLETIDGQSTPGLIGTVLELGDDRVVDLFLLLAEEMGADGVQRVGTELVVSLHDGEDVELQSTVEVDRLGVARPVGLGAEVRVLGLGLVVCDDD